MRANITAVVFWLRTCTRLRLHLKAYKRWTLDSQFVLHVDTCTSDSSSIRSAKSSPNAFIVKVVIVVDCQRIEYGLSRWIVRASQA